jgi:hypothetical protein
MKPDTREPDTREFEALREKVRVLLAEYQEPTEGPRKPAKSK